MRGAIKRNRAQGKEIKKLAKNCLITCCGIISLKCPPDSDANEQLVSGTI